VSSSRCGIFVPVEVRFKWTNTLSHENAIFWGLWDEVFNWDRLRRFIAGYQPPTKPVPARSGTSAPSPRRLATKSSGSGMKSPPGKAGARRTQEGPGALAQARTVDLLRKMVVLRHRDRAMVGGAALSYFISPFVKPPRHGAALALIVTSDLGLHLRNPVLYRTRL
jgi:hypothetical protein